jgi:3-oxoacyl-[acyl-carrier protein] reductase
MQAPVLILGASGTLGGAVAQRLFQSGNRLILHGNKNKSKLEELAKSCGDAPIVTADLSDENAFQAMFETIEASGDGLSGLVLAVACPFPHKLAHNTPWSVFQEQMDSQLKAAHLSLTAALPLLKACGSARVLIVSTEYVMGMPPIKVAPYVAAKAALTAYAKVIAQEWINYNMRVHILAPGMVVSNLTADLPEMYLEQVAEAMPEKCLTTAHDVADVAAFLMTAAADSLYGTVVPVTRAPRRSL